jgi:hypothetical protein
MMSGGREGGEGGWGQKVLSKPSADSFAVGRRQKITKNGREKQKIALLKSAQNRAKWVV